MSNKRLNAVITIGGAVAGSLTSALTGTKRQIGDIGKEISKLKREQDLLGRSIGIFGRMGKDVDGLRSKYAGVTTELDKMRRAQERLVSMQRRADNIVGFGKTAATGVIAGSAAAAMVSRPLIRAAIERENVINAVRNSGVTKEEADAMITAAEKTDKFGVDITKATDTVMELRTALGTAHHALLALPTTLKAISGLQLYDRLHHSDLSSGSSIFNLSKISEERGGSTDPEAQKAMQNWAFKAVTGSGGKITIDDLLASIRSGKGAVMGMSDEAFFGDAFLQQSMGADRYGTASSTLVNSWINGHQTHSAFEHMLKMGLLNRNRVKFDRNGRVKTIDKGALIDSQTFIKDPQKWVDEHLAPLAKKQGIDLTDPAQIMEFVGAIASNPNAANMLLSRLRFSANIAKDRHNVLQATGIDASDKANRESTAGKIENARAKLNDAEARMGQVILPVLANAMDKAATALERFTGLAESSPGLFKAITFSFVGLTASLTALTVAGIGSKLATEGLVVAQKAFSLATTTASASVGGLVATMIGRAGLVFALSQVALEVAKFLGLPDVNKEQGMKDVKAGNWWAASAHLSAGDFLSAAWEAATRPSPKSATSAGAGAPVTNNTTINVTQQPGQDSQSLVAEIIRKWNQQQRTQGRSMMYDPVTP